MTTSGLATPTHDETGSDPPCLQNVAMGKASWECIDNDSNEVLEGEEKSLLTSAFDPRLCDLCDEGYCVGDIRCQQ